MIAAACSRSGDDSGSGTDDSKGADSGSLSTSFGSLDNVCQEGDASGATAQGVTDDSIRVGTISDPGFVGRPGLNQELFDVAEVFTQWCNDRGGINGRELEVDLLDAALTDYQPRIAEACENDFFLVGGGATFDNTGVTERLTCLLPDVAGFLANSEARGADLAIQPVPNSIDILPVGDYRWLGEEFPDSTDRIGVLTGNIPITTLVARQGTEAVEALGWTVVYSDEYPVTGPPTWAPYAQSLKEQDVKGLLWTGEPENLAKLEQALVAADYELDWIRTDANHYDDKLIEVGGSAIKNTYVRGVFWPFEDAADNPATQEYLDAFAEYKPEGKKKAYLGLQAWSAWLLFAQAARECGSDLTRSCVYDNLEMVTSWTGGGLHAKQNPGETIPGDCFALLVASPDGFTLAEIEPTDGIYSCDPDNLYELTGDYPKGVTLEDVGKSEKDLQ